MSRLQGETSTGAGLSESLLRVIDGDGNVDWLRECLSGFSHRCRNSLHGMKLGMYFCKRETADELPPVWSDLEKICELIERMIERLQVIYRPMNLTLVESTLGPMVAEREASWRLSFTERAKALTIENPAGEPPGQFDPTYLGMALDAFITWRAEICPVGTKAKLSWTAPDGQFRLDWDEEIPTSTRPTFPEPIGMRPPCDDFRQEIDSLALPLLARVLGAHGGRLHQATVPAFSLQMTWPLIQ